MATEKINMLSSTTGITTSPHPDLSGRRPKSQPGISPFERSVFGGDGLQPIQLEILNLEDLLELAFAELFGKLLA